eukprot:3319828-Alexandrium_andersonii.AAC.1
MSPCDRAAGGSRGGRMASAEFRNWVTPPAAPATRLPGRPRAGSTGGDHVGGGTNGGGGGGGGPAPGPPTADGDTL